MLGTGTLNLPNAHPANVAAQVAMLDHMLQGRLIMGISPGGLMSDAEVFGNYQKDRNAIFLEAIDMVLEIWKRDGPYDLQGEHFQHLDRADDDPRDRPGHDPQAVPEAASADRRDRRRAAFEGRDRGGQARLDAHLGELPAARVGRLALAALRRGLRGRRRRGRSGRLARREVHLRRRRREHRAALRQVPGRAVPLLLQAAAAQARDRRRALEPVQAGSEPSPTRRSRRSASPTSS